MPQISYQHSPNVFILFLLNFILFIFKQINKIYFLDSLFVIKINLSFRISYLSVEKHERELTNKYKNIKALTHISYSNETINGIRVPLEYKKIFWNSKFMKCYIIKNNNIVYSLEEMKIDCLSF